jgi:hypothetical protein
VPVAREPIPAAPPPPRTERKRGTPAFVGFLLSLLAIGGIVALVMHDQGQPALVPPAASPTLVAPDPPHAPTDPTPAAPDPAAPPAAPEGPAGSTVPPEDIQGIEDVLNAIETGRRDEAMRLLQIHRQLRPRSAYLAYLHGNVFFDRMWWTQGFAAYEVAIKHNPAYKSDPVLIRNVLRSLWSAKAYRRGQTFLLKLGKPALPAVRAMADAVKSPHVKARATAMAKRLEAL